MHYHARGQWTILTLAGLQMMLKTCTAGVQEQPPLAQDLGRRGWNDEHRFTLGRKPLSQRASGTSPDGGILSLKLSADGYLETKNSDVKVEVSFAAGLLLVIQHTMRFMERSQSESAAEEQQTLEEGNDMQCCSALCLSDEEGLGFA